MPTYEINIGGEPVEKGDEEDIVEIGQRPTVDENQPDEQVPDVMPGLQEVPFDKENEEAPVNIHDVEEILRDIEEKEQEEKKREQKINDDSLLN